MSAPIGYALDSGEGEAHWFLGARATYKTTRAQSGGFTVTITAAA